MTIYIHAASLYSFRCNLCWNKAKKRLLYNLKVYRKLSRGSAAVIDACIFVPKICLGQVSCVLCCDQNMFEHDV